MATEFQHGWYVDPSDSTRVRYWDGSRWTKDTWSLAGVEGSVERGPTPPLRLVLDEDAESVDVADESFDRGRHRHASRGGRLAYRLVGGVAIVALVATGAWVALLR
jgi:hypothetical protein